MSEHIVNLLKGQTVVGIKLIRNHNVYELQFDNGTVAEVVLNMITHSFTGPDAVVPDRDRDRDRDPTKPFIDWSEVPAEYQFMATDASRRTYLYQFRPAPDRESRSWEHARGGLVHPAEFYGSFEPGTGLWTESLVERPDGV